MTLKRKAKVDAPAPAVTPKTFDPETQSAVDLDDGEEAVSTSDELVEYVVRLQHRHANWLKARATIENRTIANMIDHCVRQAWQQDQDRVTGGSVVVGSKAQEAIIAELAQGEG